MVKREEVSLPTQINVVPNWLSTTPLRRSDLGSWLLPDVAANDLGLFWMQPQHLRASAGYNQLRDQIMRRCDCSKRTAQLALGGEAEQLRPSQDEQVFHASSPCLVARLAGCPHRAHSSPSACRTGNTIRCQRKASIGIRQEPSRSDMIPSRQETPVQWTDFRGKDHEANRTCISINGDRHGPASWRTGCGNRDRAGGGGHRS